jgi:hypothetical protein
MLTKKLIAGILSFIVTNAYSQLTERDTLQFGYKISSTGSWITGNVERLIISNTLDLSHLGKKVGIKSSNSYIYGTIFKNETENDVFSRNFFYLNPRKRAYPYVMAWFQHSQRQQIQFRHQVGIGATYTLIDKMNHLLKISATITREQTRYNGTSFWIEPENLTNNEITNYRATTRLLGSHTLLEKRLKILYETWYQPAFDDRTNWRYLLNAGVELPISKHISFRSTLLYTHENTVLTNIKRDDKIVVFGLSISNY